MHPSLAPGAPGQMSVTELLEMRQTLGLMGTSRQFAVIGPWEGEAPKTSATASLSLRLMGGKLTFLCEYVCLTICVNPGYLKGCRRTAGMHTAGVQRSAGGTTL